MLKTKLTKEGNVEECVVVCDKCQTNIFKLKWMDKGNELGLYRSCVGCGDIQCIMHGNCVEGEING